VGSGEWDPASVFFKAENHNMHGSAIFHDGKGTLYHLNGIAPAGTKGWGKLIHLVSSALHYRFNLVWLRTAAPTE
jgi:hypothetical protein